jgi:hypothetical protein
MASQAPVQMAEGGLTTLPMPNDMFDEHTFAGGGIVAFSKGDEVDARAARLKALMVVARRGGPEGRAAMREINALTGTGSGPGEPGTGLKDVLNATYQGPRGMELLDALDKYTGMPQPGDRAPQPVSTLNAGKPGIFGNPGAFVPPDLSSITDAAQQQNAADMNTSYGLPFGAPSTSSISKWASQIGNADAAGDVLYAAGSGMAAKKLKEKLDALDVATGMADAPDKPRMMAASTLTPSTPTMPAASPAISGIKPITDVNLTPYNPNAAAPSFDSGLAMLAAPLPQTGAFAAAPRPRVPGAPGAMTGKRGAVPNVKAASSVKATTSTTPDMTDEELAAKRNRDFLEANKIPEYKGTSAEDKAAQKNEDLWTSLAQIGFGMAAGKSPNALSNIGEAAAAAIPGMQAAIKERRADTKEELKQKYAYELAKAGVTGKAYEFSINQFDKLKDNKYRESTLAETIRHNEAQERLTKQQIAQAGVTGPERLMREWIAADPKRREVMKGFFEAQSAYGGQKLGLAEEAAITAAEKNIDAKYKDQITLLSLSKSKAPELAALMQKINAEKYAAAQRIRRSSLEPSDTEAPPPPSGYVE